MKLFQYNGYQLRAVVINDEPHWVAKDVCEILDFSNNRDALSRLDVDEKGVASIDTLGGKQEMAVVNESGLYNLILGSRKPEAKAFKRWVTHEVLPSIRKHGAYMTPDTIEKTLTNPDFIIQLATQLKTEQQAREAEAAARLEAERKLTQQAPKVALYDTAMNAGNNKPIGTVAKMLGYGPNKLFAFLRDLKILRRNNEPYQEFIDRGYFDVRMYSFPHSNGEIENKTQPLVTPKGIEYIYKLLVKHGKIPAQGA